MEHPFIRTELLLGTEGIERLQNASVCIFGLGGVGSFVAEGLARAGVGALTLVDHDCVSVSNLNRQLVALHSTIGQRKVDVAAARIRDINPNCAVTTYPCFFTKDEVPLDGFDYIADAIDSVSSKLTLIETAVRAQIPILSCMGTGNKLDPSRLVLTDLAKTEQCPLAKVMRVSLRKRGIHHLPVLYSTEPPVPHKLQLQEDGTRKTIGSVSFVPSVAGLMIAGEIVRNIALEHDPQSV